MRNDRMRNEEKIEDRRTAVSRSVHNHNLSSIGRRSVECREGFYNVRDDVVVIGERRADSRISVYVVPEGQGI